MGRLAGTKMYSKTFYLSITVTNALMLAFSFIIQTDWQEDRWASEQVGRWYTRLAAKQSRLFSRLIDWQVGWPAAGLAG